MESPSISQLSRSIDQLKFDIEQVEANCTLDKKKDDHPYMTELASLYHKLHMIKSAVDALLSKISDPGDPLQTRQQSGRGNRDRDSGVQSADSAIFRSRDSGILESGLGLQSVDQQCPSNLQVPRPLQETEHPQVFSSVKTAAENAEILNRSSDDDA